MSDSPPSSMSRAPLGRLAITLALPLALAFMPSIGLPGVDATDPSLLVSRSNFDVFALGVAPFVSASLIVEIGALTTRRWRALRNGGPAGRAKLARATLFIAALLCASQAFAITTLLQGLPQMLTGSFSASLAVLTMTAGSFLLALAAHLVSVHGLAGGMALLTITTAFHGVGRQLETRVRTGQSTPVDLLAIAAITAAIALATGYMLREPKAEQGAEAADPTYREAPERDARLPIQIPAPASGLAPLAFSASLLSLPTTLAALNLLPELAAALAPSNVFRGASLIVIAVGALVLTWAMNQPARVAALGVRMEDGTSIANLASEARGALRLSALRSLAFLVALFAVNQLAASFAGSILTAGGVALLTALALDVAAEWRARRSIPDLVAVWPEHRSYAIPFARAALAAEGIAVHARGERLHRLLQFFGPYAPVDLMVARADEARATKILTSLLLARPEEEDETTAEAEPTGAPAKRWTREETSLLGAIALVAAGAMILPGVAPSFTISHEPARPARPASLQLLAIDDEIDPLDPAPEALPQGVSIALENVSLGKQGASYRQGARRYARIVKLDGESLEQARTRLVTWAEKQLDLHGGRVLAGPVLEAEEGSGEVEQVGFRTYVVKGDPIVDGSHVRAAHAQMDDADRALPSWSVRVELTPEGAERIRAFTAANVRRRMAIAIDGVVNSAPLIMSEIPGGVVSISMGQGSPEAQARDAKQLEKQLLGR